MATPVCLSLSVISFLVKNGYGYTILIDYKVFISVTLSHLIVNCATALNGF